MAAVTVGGDGAIIKCKIDASQASIEFGKDGKLITPVDTIFKGKQDLKEEYGLKKASGIGKEWYQQADAFADYCVGKTADDISGIAVTDEGLAADTDLSSSVTIHIGDFIAAVDKAVKSAKELGAGPDDTLGLGVETNISHSTNATADEDGIAEAYTNYVATTFNADKQITSTFIDAVQADVNFDTTGKITSDLKAEIKTKQELGDDYGLKAASGIGKEWFEQVDALANYVKGMTVDQVKGIKVNDEGVAQDKDLTSSVTIGITDYITIIQMAAANAA